MNPDSTEQPRPTLDFELHSRATLGCRQARGEWWEGRT